MLRCPSGSCGPTKVGRVDDPVQATVLLRDAGKRLAVREAGRQHTMPFFPIVQYASTWAYKGSARVAADEGGNRASIGRGNSFAHCVRPEMGTRNELREREEKAMAIDG